MGQLLFSLVFSYAWLSINEVAKKFKGQAKQV